MLSFARSHLLSTCTHIHLWILPYPKEKLQSVIMFLRTKKYSFGKLPTVLEFYYNQVDLCASKACPMSERFYYLGLGSFKKEGWLVASSL